MLDGQLNSLNICLQALETRDYLAFTLEYELIQSRINVAQLQQLLIKLVQLPYAEYAEKIWNMLADQLSDKLLDKKIDPLNFQLIGNGMAHHAASKNHPQWLRIMHLSGVDLDAKNAKGQTALMLAAKFGHMESVLEIASMKPDGIKDTNPQGWTPLMFAAHAGHRQIVEHFIQFGADINQVDWFNQTALHIVMIRLQNSLRVQDLLLPEEMIDVINLLIQHDAEFLLDRFDKDPLMYCPECYFDQINTIGIYYPGQQRELFFLHQAGIAINNYLSWTQNLVSAGFETAMQCLRSRP